MGIIETQVKNAFDRFKKDGKLLDLVMKLICDVDHTWQFVEVRDAIRKQCPKPIFECVYYNGEYGTYHLFDFDPNPISRESLLVEVRARLQSECYIDPDYVDKAMQSVYLIDTNAMRKVMTE